MDKKRPVFDSAKNRAQGTELAAYHQQNQFLKKTSKTTDPVKKKETKAAVSGRDDTVIPTLTTAKSGWRAKHEQFIRAIRIAKGTASEDDIRASQSSVNLDGVACPICQRRFNEVTSPIKYYI